MERLKTGMAAFPDGEASYSSRRMASICSGV